ncbi:hypothetical protein BDZ97DRAFT_1778146 [Flammula alnicola]|nr:hypothetical protein BDZ97DRAFT_1778146 [Flammula alnicola]
MEHPGLLSWANSIRLTMASDPGRQVFKDQVQTHGFMFLDDYLDNIVSGAKQDPLIELVKTPGRKKAIARKPKLMSSKLANTVSLSLEDQPGDENQAPINSFQAALDKLSSQKVASDALKAEENKRAPDIPTRESNQRSPLAPVQPLEDASFTRPEHHVLSVPPPANQPTVELVSLPSMEHNDLSVIAEDDEPSERSRTSTSGRTEAIPKSPLRFPEVLEGSNASPRLSAWQPAENISQHELNLKSTSSIDTFHSIPLDSPTGQCPDDMDASQPSQSLSDKLEGSLAGNDTGPLPRSKSTQDSAMAQVPEDTSPTDRKSSDKPTAPSFPTLPEPMPLRKSMRPPRDPSLNTVMLGAATPGAPVGGKRTSWLMKAREVKALEGPTKKAPANLNLGSSVFLQQGTKRKSENMLSIPPVASEEEERQLKSIKTAEGETASRKSKDAKTQEQPTVSSPMTQQTSQPEEPTQEGVLDRLKKTVEGLGVRVSKTLGKSLGGDAATALAEARAAAEARVAERDRKEEEITMAMGMPPVPANRADIPQDTDVIMSSTRQNEGRLSISDLFPADGRIKEKHKAPEKPFQFTPSLAPPSVNRSKESATARESTSTTPPNSPPAQTNTQSLPPTSVFNKPPPVFIPPAPAPAPALSNPTPPTSTQQSVFNSAPTFNVRASSIFGFSPQTASSTSPKGKTATPLTAQSTLESVQSDGIFERDVASAWIPNSQDTVYTSAYGSQSQPLDTQICDEDDSWPMDEKLAAGVQWTFGASKEDSMTWSTLPSQSQRADTGPATKTSSVREVLDEMGAGHQIPGAFDVDMDNACENEALVRRDVELEDIILRSSKATVSIVEPKIARSQSQLSMASSESSQSQVGFLGQASKLLSSALGTSKKKQPEVKKVLQMAAVAAKKQQEEADKKAARLKEMESRRQLALQRKAEEEKAKALEEERKMKEEVERRKREREDLTDKRAIKLPSGKREEDTQKKRKLETEKKQEIKKPGPSVLVGKSHLKTALKQTTASNSSFAFGALTQTPAAESSSSLHKGKSAAQQPVLDDDVSQPSQLVQSQMAARAKAQIDAAKHIEPPVPSESIELPDINSEYSDSEDEDRVRTFDPPEWAQSPELRQALEMQSTINPDDIFGAVRPLRMEEIFKTRTSRFRARSSSANWTGTDRLTIQEEKDYARRMGFK